MPGIDELIGEVDEDDLLDLISGEDDEDDEDDEETGIEEIIGALELIGEDDEDDDEFGARGGKKRRRRMKRLKKKLRALRKAGRGKSVQKVRHVRGRVLMFGGVVDATVAGAIDLTTTVPEVCRPGRIYLTAAVVAGAVIALETFSVVDIKVGTRSQFSALPSLPAPLFSADATSQGYGLKLDTIQSGTDFTMRLNVATVPGRYQFGCYATALR